MRRARFDIISDILKVSKNGAKISDILSKAKLSFKQFKNYVSLLEERNFLNRENNNGNVRYKTSENGKVFLKAYEDLQSTLTYN